ncbi:hypothetical protein NMQ14_03265 [Methyloversatilis sp. XJ19-13]|uniref:hypothetical protein n=1 Tax=Methyloversatilis sp. XJ19-13 TaxID=2963430 RepID=UPI00211CF5EB|nr:hypothetical protein [Methyloversatilis sp. XJ19-13]MCQ9373264.1 hypothetical protein [Methyloversatilis sp. XJ19-13]
MDEGNSFATLINEWRDGPASLWFVPFDASMFLCESAPVARRTNMQLGLKLDHKNDLLRAPDDSLRASDFRMTVFRAEDEHALGKLTFWPAYQTSYDGSASSVLIEVKVPASTFDLVLSHLMNGRLPGSITVDVEGLQRGSGFDPEYIFPTPDSVSFKVVGVSFALPLIEARPSDDESEQPVRLSPASSDDVSKVSMALEKIRVTLIERSRLVVIWLAILTLVALFK